MAQEKAFVLIKSDGVKRGIVGKIISRFEESGLKIVAMKMIHSNKELAKRHYFLDEEWAKNVYEKSKKSHDKEGRKFPYKDHMHIGKTIQSWNCEFLCEGLIIAMVLQCPHTIEIVRKLVGSTEPRSSIPGTIHSDFISIESYAVFDENKRVIRNLVHASDSEERAKHEIALWFSPNEIHENYKTATEMLLYENSSEFLC